LALIRKKGDPTEIKDAENKLNDAIVDQVQAKGDQATATAEANGQSLTAAQVAAIQRGELINLRETTGAYTTDLDVLLVQLTQVTNQYGAATEAVKAHERALAAAKKHRVVDGWSWERLDVDTDAAPLVAVTGALALQALHREDSASYDATLSVY